MPKVLFYAGTAFCLFLALTSAAQLTHQLQGGAAGLAALHGGAIAPTTTAAWAIVVALLGGLAVASILVRMAALLAPRDLFAAFLSLFSVSAAVLSLAWLLLLQSRLLMLARAGATTHTTTLFEMHFAATMMLGSFVSISLLALRPYFRVQASRVLSALVFFPLPLFGLIAAQELFVTTTLAPLPAVSPASMVFLGVLAILFFSIAVHCIRHRHMFIELTNLRELLDSRIDPAQKGRPIGFNGGVAFDA